MNEQVLQTCKNQPEISGKGNKNNRPGILIKESRSWNNKKSNAIISRKSNSIRIKKAVESDKNQQKLFGDLELTWVRFRRSRRMSEAVTALPFSDSPRSLPGRNGCWVGAIARRRRQTIANIWRQVWRLRRDSHCSLQSYHWEKPYTNTVVGLPGSRAFGHGGKKERTCAEYLEMTETSREPFLCSSILMGIIVLPLHTFMNVRDRTLKTCPSHFQISDILR